LAYGRDALNNEVSCSAVRGRLMVVPTFVFQLLLHQLHKNTAIVFCNNASSSIANNSTNVLYRTTGSALFKSLSPNIWFASFTLVLCGIYATAHIYVLITNLTNQKYRKEQKERLTKKRPNGSVSNLLPKRNEEKR